MKDMKGVVITIDFDENLVDHFNKIFPKPNGESWTLEEAEKHLLDSVKKHMANIGHDVDPKIVTSDDLKGLTLVPLDEESKA